jgi:RNA polymerase sigma factor (sigma-70 family)
LTVIQNTYTEFELVAALKQKNEKAFSYLYDNYAFALSGVVFSIVNDKEITEEIIQDAFVKIWNNVADFDETKGRLYTWMRRIVNNLAIDVLRSKQYKKQKAVLDSELVVEHLKAEDTLQLKINNNYLKQKITQLKEKEINIIQLSYFEGFTQEEIAKQLEMPIGTVKSRIRSAIIELRKILKQN